MSTEPKWWLLSARNGIIDERSAYNRNAHVMGSFNDPFIENWVICNESLVKSKKNTVSFLMHLNPCPASPQKNLAFAM